VRNVYLQIIYSPRLGMFYFPFGGTQVFTGQLFPSILDSGEYTNFTKEKQPPNPAASNTPPAVQISSAVPQKVVPVEAEPPRTDGSDKYFGMENVRFSSQSN
jgi:hypothetical protein